jgi:hypothetical protein
MAADFPAAHSMDSCWFAVDRDGHVGFFTTGEAGAMPAAGVTGDAAYQLCDRLAGAVPPGEVIFDPRGYVLPGPAGEDAAQVRAQDWPLLVFLTSLAPVRSDVEAGQATPVRATEGYAVVLPRVTADQARRLTESGAVRATAFFFGGPDDERNSRARFGVYEYGHLCENWIAGPYGRERVPARPLHVDQLPPAVRKQLKEATLAGLSFAEATHIQPAEHWECETWESGWLGLDGVVRPFPGREADFRAHAEEMREFFPRLRLEEPGE